MKASELIKELQEKIKLHGDLDCVRDDYGDYDIEGVSFISQEETRCGLPGTKDLFRLE